MCSFFGKDFSVSPSGSDLCDSCLFGIMDCENMVSHVFSTKNTTFQQEL